MKLIEQIPQDLLDSTNKFAKELEESRRLPIYEYHKWWARRFSGIARLFLIYNELEYREIENVEDFDKFVEKTYHNHELKSNSKILLDPFAGGGTIVFEGSKIGYKSKAIDVNNIACKILRAPSSFSKLSSMKKDIIKVTKDTGGRWKTTCEECGNHSTIIHTFLYWEDCDGKPQIRYNEVKRSYDGENATYYCEKCNEVFYDESNLSKCPYCGSEFGKEVEEPEYREVRPYAVEYKCDECGERRIKEVSKEGLRKFSKRSGKELSKIPDLNETSRLLKHGFTSFDELFSNRQLYTFSKFLGRFKNTEFEDLSEIMVSDSLRCCSYLAHFSPKYRKVIPGFTIRSYWLPVQPVELNPLSFRFTNDEQLFPVGRGNIISVYRRMRKAEKWRAENGYNFNKLDVIEGAAQDNVPEMSETVDTVFTDPPYFDYQYYSDLSLFNTSMVSRGNQFREYVNYLKEKEIVARTKEDLERYKEMLYSVFDSIVEILKPNGNLIMTFHHSDSDIVTEILDIFKKLPLSLRAVYPVMGESPSKLTDRKLYIDLLFVFKNNSSREKASGHVYTTQTEVYENENDLELINSITQIARKYRENEK